MLVFISYAHENEKFKEGILTVLKPLKDSGINIWESTSLHPGSTIDEEIKGKINKADAAIILVSKASLNSDYIKNIELPLLINRRQQHGLQIFPILVDNCVWEHHNWFSRIEMCPKVDGKLLPLCELENLKRDSAYKKIAEYLVSLNDDIESGNVTMLQNINLNSASGRKEFAKELVSIYQHSPDKSMNRLVKEYLSLHKQGNKGYSKDLINKFTQFLQKFSIEIEDEIHEDIRVLFEAGLPEEPVHLKGISEITEQSLFKSGFAVLLHAIFQLEQEKHQEAISLLNAEHDYNTLNNCPYRKYILGQCLRKCNCIKEAETELQRAVEDINKSKWSCARICACNKDALLVGVHRGLGVILRKQFNYMEAERQFRLAKEAFTEDISSIVKADVCFSYGYLVYESAFKSYDNDKFHKYEIIDEQEYKDRIEKAKSLFEESCQFRDDWDAPRFRLAIVKQLLGQKENAINDYLRARPCGIENGIEGHLSAVICGIAVLLLAPQHPYSFNSKKLFNELKVIFMNNYVSFGARECHAFDVYAIASSNEINGTSLEPVYKLLCESAEWKCKNLDEQKNLMMQFIKKRSDEA